MITLINGRLQGANGNFVPNGFITLSLSSDAQVNLAPYGRVSASIPITFSLDSGGNMPAGAQIWSNAELSPPGTSYLVNFYDSNNARLSSQVWQFSQGNGSTVDVGSITPVSTGSISTYMNRLILAGGTALTASNFTLSAGFGSTASVSSVVGTDSNWQITVTAGGSGIASIPTITLTFADGAWPNAPIAQSKPTGGTGGLVSTQDATTTTTWTMTFLGTPGSGSTYSFEGLCIGR